MLRLKSLGQTLIEVDDARLTPAAETLFATALYLIVETGRPVDRDELARMIWPGVSDARAQHGLRQVLYKLKSMGAAIKTDRSTLMLASRYCVADYAPLLAPQGEQGLEALADLVGGVFLPGYRPQLSEEFTVWIERQRDLVHSAMIRTLVTGISGKKGSSDWNGAERLARLCLSIDPLNEEATLTIAEAAALGGSKAKALSILNHYLKEIGADAREIRLPAAMLRKRISEAYQDSEFTVKDAPLVGRDEELAELTRALTRARRGRGSAFLIWGEPGIGKTRLVTEFILAASLTPVHVTKVRCQSYDTRRPLSAIVDLVPKLLSMPGALGCSPESMRCLRRLTAHDPGDAHAQEELEREESRYENTRLAIFDLIDSVSSELCCIIVIDNAHWLDAQSERLLDELLDRLRSWHVLLVLTSRTQSLHNEGLSLINLRPLLGESSRKVAFAVVNSNVDAPDGFIGWCVTTSGGNPYYLLELLRHGTKEHHGYRPPASLTRLLQDRVESLSQNSRLLLEACCVLGKHSTLARIEACVETRKSRILRALSDLEARGLIDLDGEHVLSKHDLLTSVVLRQTRSAAKAMLHRFVAQQLEDEANATQSVSLLWESAEHWYSAAETARAIQLLRRCGEHLMDVGIPLEAANVLGRALALASSASEQYEIGAQQVRALMHAECDEECLNELEKLLKLRASIVPEPFQLDEIGWMHLIARWNSGVAEVDLLSDNLEALATGRGSLQDRIRAAAWLLAAADNICDSNLGHRIYQLVQPSLHTLDIAAEIRLSFELVYHCSFGDRHKSVELARELFAHARDYRRVPFAIRYMRYAGETFRCHGTTDCAVAAYEAAYSAATSINAQSAMANCAASLASTYLHVGNLDMAENYMRLATGCRVPDKATLLDTTLLSNNCELAIKRNDLTTAASVLGRIESALPINDSPRSKSRKIALQVAILLAGDAQPNEEEFAELSHCFAVTRRSTRQDFTASVLIRALSSAGRDDEARQVASQYVEHDRRDLCQTSHDLSYAIRRLSTR